MLDVALLCTAIADPASGAGGAGAPADPCQHVVVPPIAALLLPSLLVAWIMYRHVRTVDPGHSFVPDRSTRVAGTAQLTPGFNFVPWATMTIDAEYVCIEARWWALSLFPRQWVARSETRCVVPVRGRRIDTRGGVRFECQGRAGADVVFALAVDGVLVELFLRYGWPVAEGA